MSWRPSRALVALLTFGLAQLCHVGSALLVSIRSPNLYTILSLVAFALFLAHPLGDMKGLKDYPGAQQYTSAP
jgi:hypothetical protein